MTNQHTTVPQFLMPLAWLGVGYLSSILSRYLFAFLISPLTIDFFRTVNATTDSAVINGLATIAFAYSAHFLLAFLLAAAMGYLFEPTFLRGCFFYLGTAVISLYGKTDALIHTASVLAEMHPAARVFAFMQFASELVVIPLLVAAGMMAGRWIRNRHMTVSDTH